MRAAVFDPGLVQLVNLRPTCYGLTTRVAKHPPVPFDVRRQGQLSVDSSASSTPFSQLPV